MLSDYIAVEYDDSLKETGKVEHYSAGNIDAAVNSCLYFHRLHRGSAYIGHTGRTVYCGQFSYAIVLLGDLHVK